MSSKNPDRIASIEKAISEKYGTEAIQNPRANWDPEKEKEYLKQMREHYKKHTKNDEWQEKVDINGIKVSKKLLSRESVRYCSVCGASAQKALDDVCFVKFDCCSKCYVNFVEDREERWEKGWRPNEN
tara:strand:- start:1376 stop:1759 length:384 start_codon:yes stop_codon:yes gene_type:complete